MTDSEATPALRRSHRDRKTATHYVPGLFQLPFGFRMILIICGQLNVLASVNALTARLRRTTLPFLTRTMATYLETTKTERNTVHRNLSRLPRLPPRQGAKASHERPKLRPRPQQKSPESPKHPALRRPPLVPLRKPRMASSRPMPPNYLESGK